VALALVEEIRDEKGKRQGGGCLRIELGEYIILVMIFGRKSVSRGHKGMP